MLCGTLLDQFLEHKKMSVSAAAYRKIRTNVNCYIRPKIGKKKISQLSEIDLQKIIDYAYLHPAADWCGKLAQKSLNTLRANITGWLKFCRMSRATTLRGESLTLPKGAKKPNKTILPLEDLLTLFRSTETAYYGKPLTDWYIHAYRVEVLTGMRPGELLGLQWGDISKGIIHIRRSINNDGLVTDGKNENAKRSIAVTPLIAEELAAQKQQLKDAGLKSKWIFPDWDGLLVQQQMYRKNWYRYLAHNGMKKIIPYELRHTFISICDEMPLSLKQKVVGHSKNMDTEGVYGHLKQGDVQRAGQYTEAAFRRLLDGEDTDNPPPTVPT